ncbi:MAG: GNAT family N-acetyltransferase [Clostridiaceae bacterium]
MLSVIGINETKKWDDLVKSFKEFDVHYLNGYAKAFEIHGDGEPLLLYYEHEGTRAINVVLKRDIAKTEAFKDKLEQNLWFDLSTPYGYGGFLLEGNDSKSVCDDYTSFCKENGFVSEFVRFNLFSGFESCYSGSIRTPSHNIVRTLDLSIEEILMDFEHKVRTNLGKAIDADLKIEFDEKGERLEEFLKLYHSTMERICADQYYYFPKDFFDHLNRLEEGSVFVHVLYEDQVIASTLTLYGKENCYPFLCGSNHDYFNLRPNEFMQVETIKWAKAKGLKRLVLGGGYGEDDGIYRYKKGFAPKGIYNYYVGMNIFDEARYEKLVEMRRKEADFNPQKDFFPLYRG